MHALDSQMFELQRRFRISGVHPDTTEAAASIARTALIVDPESERSNARGILRAVRSELERPAPRNGIDTGRITGLVAAFLALQKAAPGSPIAAFAEGLRPLIKDDNPAYMRSLLAPALDAGDILVRPGAAARALLIDRIEKRPTLHEGAVFAHAASCLLASNDAGAPELGRRLREIQRWIHSGGLFPDTTDEASVAALRALHAVGSSS